MIQAKRSDVILMPKKVCQIRKVDADADHNINIKEIEEKKFVRKQKKKNEGNYRTNNRGPKHNTQKKKHAGNPFEIQKKWE